ncbi:Egg protein CP82, related [Eimeria mitis]|uniref:Egg protein CP82, related n=1 Tax=Eimeria mitis TaxID=44415 RepID=U6KIH5_9EIME|nr:Egg protein CP82, related [Eimeria mitis]CDJ35263.1 Egg protein CP82, related [Eimeria mitis]
MTKQGRRCLWGLYTGCPQRPSTGYCPVVRYATRNLLPAHRQYEESHTPYSISNLRPTNGSISINNSSRGGLSGQHSSLLIRTAPWRKFCRLGVSLTAATPAATNPAATSTPPGTGAQASTPTCIGLATETKSDLNRSTADAAAVATFSDTVHSLSRPCRPLVFGGLSTTHGSALKLGSDSPLDGAIFCVGGETTVVQWSQELQKPQQRRQQQVQRETIRQKQRLCTHLPLKASVGRLINHNNDTTNNSSVTCSLESSCNKGPGFYNALEGEVVTGAAAETSPTAGTETDQLRIDRQHSEVPRKGQVPSALVAATLAAPACASSLAPSAESQTDFVTCPAGLSAALRGAEARSAPVGSSGGTTVATLSSPVALASDAAPGEADSALRRDIALATAKPSSAVPSSIASAAAVLVNGAVAVVPACSSCSLSSASVWKKWLLLLCESDPHRRQELLLKYPPLCKRHSKNIGQSGHRDFVVGFRQLRRLLEAAALHPHATEACVSVLRQRLRLGVDGSAAGEGTVAAAAGAGSVAEHRGVLSSADSATAVQVARCLAYVEGGLAMLALEKGAQLMQSLRDFDCADSFLLEATADGTACGVTCGYGDVDTVAPGDASALLAKELRLLHGDSFDFSCVTAQVAAAAAAAETESIVDTTASRPDVLKTTPIYDGDRQCLRRMQQQPPPPVLQELLKIGGGKHRVRCVICGRSLIVSADELLRGPLNCPDCEASSTVIKGAPASTAVAARRQTQCCDASCAEWSSVGNSASLMNDVQQQKQCEYGDVRHVLQQLEAATSWGTNRFALASPAFIASVCSSSRLSSIKVRVHPFPEPASRLCGSFSSTNAADVETAETAPGPSQTPAEPQLQHVGKRGFTLSAGTRFWAMPVSFIEAVHTRQVEALERLAETSSLQLLPAANAAVAPTTEGRGSAAAAHLCGNRILEVLTATEGYDAHRDIKTTSALPPLVSDDEAAAKRPFLDVQTAGAFCGTRLSAAASPAAAHIGEVRESYVAVTAVPFFDDPGVETVRLSDEAAVLDALQASTPPHKGHRLAKLKLQPRRVLVDESSQITEFAGLGALVDGVEVVVLIGDERQLPPASALQASASPRSLFSALKGGACRSVLLNLQFRMPPLLAAFISSHFYDGKLLTHPSRADPLSFHEPKLPLPSKQPQRHQQRLQRRQLQASDSVDLTPLLEFPQHVTTDTHQSSATSQDNNGMRTILGKTASLHCKDPNEGNLTAVVNPLDMAQDEFCFPWPDGSEGDKDLAKRLMEQLGAQCKSSGETCPSSRWVQEMHRYPIPNVLPILFLDTSPWASGPSRRLARIALPSSAPEAAVATFDLADAAGSARSASGCKPLIKSLPAEQRVKSSLQNPLSVIEAAVVPFKHVKEAFMVYRCVEVLLSCGASKQDIAVLTPYQAQAQLLSRVLHREREDNARGSRRRSSRLSFVQPALDVLDERCRPHPQVFTVDGFQGHEREYIILSTVKGSRKSIREFFLFDPRRINVALSRASRGLIIVGNAQALADASPTWSSFVLFLRTLGAALPLDHPSLRKSLTKGMLLPRPKPPQWQDPPSDLNHWKRMPSGEGEHEDLKTSPQSAETS